MNAIANGRMQWLSLSMLALATVGSAFIFPASRPGTRLVAEPLTKLNVVVSETTREGVPMPEPNVKPATDKLFVYLWIDHLGNRVYRATRNIGASPRRIQLWNPLASDADQAYPETGDSTAPSFTKYEVLGDDNLDAWVESGFGEFDDVEPSPVAYTIEGAEEGGARGEMEGEGQREEAKELTSEEIEASINAYNEYYPPASFDALVTAMQASWRTIILSRGKQGAKAMREFYRDLHKAHPELEQKVWIMETHATRSPVPEDPDTYNHWMSDEDILKMARVATDGHDDVVEFSGLEFEDSMDGIKGEDWVTIPPPLSWFKDEAKK
ncbi:hypothetical protein Naga_100105g16 [Nannochloropsis gaditana]|uniref:Uncharacterized protein n=1 Tax=Nannochloropsis gaditana TaxID=72520 RepID=W7TB65_9STRA|nr:hypothetical protein Naga_100105g16 [Nannochloropsis gaditana]